MGQVIPRLKRLALVGRSRHGQHGVVSRSWGPRQVADPFRVIYVSERPPDDHVEPRTRKSDAGKEAHENHVGADASPVVVGVAASRDDTRVRYPLDAISLAQNVRQDEAAVNDVRDYSTIGSHFFTIAVYRAAATVSAEMSVSEIDTSSDLCQLTPVLAIASEPRRY